MQPETSTITTEPVTVELPGSVPVLGIAVTPCDPVAALILSPALGTPAGFYRRLGVMLAERGIAVLLHEQRGHGTSPVRAGRDSDWGYRELVEVELPALVANMRGRWPSLPLFLGGHSLGAQLACLASSALAEPPAGLLLIASGVQHARLYRPSWRFRVRLGAVLFPPLARWRGFHDGPRLGFGSREPVRLMTDWARVVRSGRYEPAGTTVDYESKLKQLDVPTLMLIFSDDEYAPRRAARALTNKMSRNDVTYLEWGATELGAAKPDHFDWARQPLPVAEAMVAWIDGIMARTPNGAS